MKRRTNRGWGLLLILCALALWGVPVAAVQTREFVASSSEELLLGEATGVGVTPGGALIVAPSFERIFFGEAAYVWSLLADGRGGVFAATGSDGRLYEISAQGDVTVAAETFEYELFALTVGRGDALYFSGAPNGTVTRRTPDGLTETVIDLPEGLVWSLLAAPGGEVYAATGDQGEIYLLADDGTTIAVGRVPDAHAVCLAWQADRLLCGTDGRGLLVAFDPHSGESQVLYDTGQEEVVALLPREDGSLLFAANGKREKGSSAANSSETIPPGTMMLARIEVGAGQACQACLYERLPSGLVRRVWRCPEEDILDLAVAPDGTVLASTGSGGVLYALDAQWNATRLLKLEEDQLLALAVDGSRVFVGTGNGGAVYRLDWETPREGTYTSRVWDAGQTVRWGMPDWIATGRGTVSFETRSGHLGTPDETWSHWAQLGDGRIVSPTARFLQWRVIMQTDASDGLAIRAIRVAYRGPNRPPVVASVSVSSLAADLQAAGSSSSVRQTLSGGVEVEYSFSDNSAEGEMPRTGVWARTLRSVTWEAADLDRDALRYDIYLHPLSETDFILLERDAEEQAFTWDAAAWPDGWYEVKIVARDERGNSPGEALRGERISAPFRIDNRPPELEDLQLVRDAGGLMLTGWARDVGGRLAALEISVDGEPWHLIHPLDGILDGAREELRSRVPARADGRGPAVVAVRVADEVGHVAVARLAVTPD